MDTAVGGVATRLFLHKKRLRVCKVRRAGPTLRDRGSFFVSALCVTFSACAGATCGVVICGGGSAEGPSAPSKAVHGADAASTDWAAGCGPAAAGTAAGGVNGRSKGFDAKAAPTAATSAALATTEAPPAAASGSILWA